MNSTQIVYDTVHCVQSVACIAVAGAVSAVAHSIARPRHSITARLGRPSPSLVATRKLCRDMRLNIPYHDREFSVSTENFEKSVATENFLSRQSSFVACTRHLLCAPLLALHACRARCHARWCEPVAPLCRDTISMSQHRAFPH